MICYLKYNLYSKYFKPSLVVCSDLKILSINRRLKRYIARDKKNKINDHLKIKDFLPLKRKDLLEIKKIFSNEQVNIKFYNYEKYGFFLKVYKITKSKLCLELIEENYLRLKKKTAKYLIERKIDKNHIDFDESEVYNKKFRRFLECRNINDIYKSIENIVSIIAKPDAFDLFMGTMNLGFKIAYSRNIFIKKPDFILKGYSSSIIKKLDKEKKIIQVNNLHEDESSDELLSYNGVGNKKHAIFIPMRDQQKLIGIICLLFNNDFKLHSKIEHILIAMANMATIASEKINYIEEQKDMQSALDRQGKLIAMGRIVAGVAHEVNNPLSIMQLDVDELKLINLQDKKYNKQIHEVTHSLQEEINRMSSIIKQLKNYSKPDHIVESEDLIDITELFRSYPIKIYLKNIQKKKISIRFENDIQNKYIKMPRNRLLQVLMNILSNADEAIENKACGEIIIKLYLSKDDIANREFVVIEVCDNGVGIKDQNLHSIFDPFFTTKIGDGTGLGLSISYSIVKKYKGEIKVKSCEGSGTSFYITFPVCENISDSDTSEHSEFCYSS